MELLGRYGPYLKSRCLQSTLCVLAVTFLWVLSPAHAHRAIEHQIVDTTKQIESDEKNASLYLQRAELHRAHQSWATALSDYSRAFELDSKLSIVHRLRAEMLVEADDLDAALRSIDSYIRAVPDDYQGRLVRARIYSLRGAERAAAAEFRQAFELADPSVDLSIDDFLDRARAFAAIGQVDEALVGLREGSRKFGKLLSLEQLAIELERADGRFDAALERIEALIDSSPRKEFWWVLKGDVLTESGEEEEARSAYKRARTAIESLPVGRRATRQTRELEARIRLRLDQSNTFSARAGPSSS